MPSVDVVSQVDLQSLDNAANNVKREVATRFDFRNVETEITLNRKESSFHLRSGDDMKIKSLREMLIDQCVRQKVDPKCLEFKEIEATSRGGAKMNITIKEGIPKETCKKMVKEIKQLKLKVQATIQDEQVRLSGKKIDDLQTIMTMLKEQDYGIPLQFINMKS